VRSEKARVIAPAIDEPGEEDAPTHVIHLIEDHEAPHVAHAVSLGVEPFVTSRRAHLGEGLYLGDAPIMDILPTYSCEALLAPEGQTE
jgi:hypothetical protein